MAQDSKSHVGWPKSPKPSAPQWFKGGQACRDHVRVRGVKTSLQAPASINNKSTGQHRDLPVRNFKQAPIKPQQSNHKFFKLSPTTPRAKYHRIVLIIYFTQLRLPLGPLHLASPPLVLDRILLDSSTSPQGLARLGSSSPTLDLGRMEPMPLLRPLGQSWFHLGFRGMGSITNQGTK